MFSLVESRIIVRMGRAVADEYSVLCEELRLLVDERAEEALPPLHLLEDRLTEGYARALELEAERLRLERRIGELGAGVTPGQPSGEEIATLAARLSQASNRLDRLRALLAALRRRADAVRTRRVALG